MDELKSVLLDLLLLQERESALAAVKSELERMPARFAAIELSLESAEKGLADARQALQDSSKNRRSVEVDVEAVRVTIRRHQDQLMLVKTNEQYRAMTKEIATERAKIDALEDTILLNLERADDLGRAIKEQEVALARERERVQAEKSVLLEEKRRLEAEQTGLEQERVELRDRIPGEPLSLYRRIAEARDGVAVVRVHGEACGICRVRGRPQALAEARSFTRLVQCETCGRILVFGPDAATQAEAGAG